MGANLRTHFLPHASIEQVEPAIGAWLSAKGFEPIERPSSAWVEHVAGRGVVLAENERGVTIAYSDPWTEGDRLIFELRRLGPVLLECWLHDSDIWGYKLFRESEVVAAFCSNPRYFGGESHDEDAIRLGRNGDAKLLTETLGLPEREQALRELQVKRRIFAENLTDAFAELIEAPALSIDYLDWQENGVHAFGDATREIAGHRIRSIVYVPRRSSGGLIWDLHRIPARQVSRPVPGEFVGDPAVITEGMIWTIAVLRALVLPIGLMLRAVLFPVLLVARFRPDWILGWFGRSPSMENVSPFRQALWDAAEAEADDESRAGLRGFVQQGDAYVHAGYGVRFVPAPGVTIDPSSPHSDLCRLLVGEQQGMLAVRDFDSTETLLGNLPGEVLDDLCETTAEGLPLRFVTAEMNLSEPVLRMHQAQRERRGRATRGWFGGWFQRRDRPSPPPAASDPEAPAFSPRLFLAIVQEERFVYQFSIALLERADDAAEALKATMRSFRRLSS